MISDIRYVDDTVTMTDNHEDLQRLLNKINIVGRDNGLKINTQKTKLIIVCREMGTLLNDEWDPQYEIKCRIQQARQVFIKLRSFLCNQSFVLLDPV